MTLFTFREHGDRSRCRKTQGSILQNAVAHWLLASNINNILSRQQPWHALKSNLVLLLICLIFSVVSTLQIKSIKSDSWTTTSHCVCQPVSHTNQSCEIDLLFSSQKNEVFFHSASVKWVDLFIIPLTNRIVSQNVWHVKLLMDKDSWPVNFLHRIYSCKCQTLVSYHESFLECSFPLHVYHHVPSIHCRLLYIIGLHTYIDIL